MSYLTRILCIACGQTKTVNVGSGATAPQLCDDCAKDRADQERRAHLAGLAALTVEERLAKIEAWIYDYRPPVPLSEMRF